MAKYKKKPVIIDAVQLTNTNYKEVKEGGPCFCVDAKDWIWGR